MLLKVEMYTEPEGEPYLLWTNKNELGEYCLDNHGGVWFTDSPDNKYLEEIDGFPHDKKPTNQVFKIKGELGVWDGNMKKVAGPFSSWDKLTEYLDSHLEVLKNMEDFEYTPEGYSDYAWSKVRKVKESKSSKVLKLIEGYK